jgi:hypothetical protein
MWSLKFGEMITMATARNLYHETVKNKVWFNEKEVQLHIS